MGKFMKEDAKDVSNKKPSYPIAEKAKPAKKAESKSKMGKKK